MEKLTFWTILKEHSMILVFTNFRSADPLHLRSAASTEYPEAEDFYPEVLRKGQGVEKIITTRRRKHV